MSKANQRIREIKQWAKGQPEVRAVILFGSQVQRGQADDLSDIDLALFVTDLEAFLADPSWAKAFGPIWLQVGEIIETTYLEKILYEDGILVEFAIQPLENLLSLQTDLTAHLEPGYKVLVDKEKAARDLPKPSGHPKAPAHPDADEYEQTLKSFWLNAFQAAKYLLRSDLWRAKHYDWQLKQELLEMMSWHALLVREQAHFTTYEGKRLQEWTDPDTYLSLMTVFGRFYPADSWRALEDTIKRFNQLSEEVASKLNANPHPELTEKFQTWLAVQRENLE